MTQTTRLQLAELSPIYGADARRIQSITLTLALALALTLRQMLTQTLRQKLTQTLRQKLTQTLRKTLTQTLRRQTNTINDANAIVTLNTT
jgi:O-antigen/teichoic acid export membrane protein